MLAGAGDDLPRLRLLVEQFGLEGRVCTSSVLSRGQRLRRQCKAAEVFVMPSRVEAFGIVVLEAWRAETPVIVTSNGGTREFVNDGITGIVVDPNQPALLARCTRSPPRR